MRFENGLFIFGLGAVGLSGVLIALDPEGFSGFFSEVVSKSGGAHFDTQQAIADWMFVAGGLSMVVSSFISEVRNPVQRISWQEEMRQMMERGNKTDGK